MDWTGLTLSIGMAVAAGLVGCFAVMRRMTLASDAMSHVALPGIGLALVFHFHPVLGGLAALLAGTLLIWWLERQTRISTETVIGVVFSLALAVGSMLATGDELVDALLGAPGTLGRWELALGLAGAAAVVAFVLTQRHRLVIVLVSGDIARTSGIRVARLELLYLLAFALTVALGLRYLGVLLMGSLVIIPAATAKHLARSLDGMFAISAGVAVSATLAGELLAPRLHRATGPLIIAIAAGMFLVGLVIRRRP
ncbi:metal ABC transporter permease [Anaeromyxobacter terrae]|uniref:metal ABC transporter permease n=1 Tax=Anaeromyxobacter terrae TaxID=2925406 RepID=UPI001F5A5803|nr:metal ABC transporter permease [Anaeromyxobacter sp. SG22]